MLAGKEGNLETRPQISQFNVYQHNGGRTDCLDRNITPDIVYSVQPLLGTTNPNLYKEAEKALAQARPDQVAIVRANYVEVDRHDVTSGKFIGYSKPRFITKP